MVSVIIGIVFALAIAALAAIDIWLIKKMKSINAEAVQLREIYSDMRKRDYSGQASWGYASVRFDDLTKDFLRKEDGGVLVKVRTPIDSEETVRWQDIIETGKILEDMKIGEVYHVSECEFLMFTANCYETSERVLEELKSYGNRKLWYAVTAEVFFPTEYGIKRYLRRMKRGIGAAEANDCRYAIY